MAIVTSRAVFTNVMCDGCKMVIEGAAKPKTDKVGAREWAVSMKWKRYKRLDLCPDCFTRKINDDL